MASVLQKGRTRAAPVPCSGHTAPNKIMSGLGTRALPCPTIGELVLLADSHLVLEPDLYRCARRELGADFRHAYGKVFLNASMASGSCL